MQNVTRTSTAIKQSHWDKRFRVPRCITIMPLQSIYEDSVDTLRSIKETVDPKNVMGLAGGI